MKHKKSTLDSCENCALEFWEWGDNSISDFFLRKGKNRGFILKIRVANLFY